MIEFRPVDLEQDYPMFESWWAGHGSAGAPKLILPRGWVAVAGGVCVAVSFLYNDPAAKIGVIEWTTTNPRCTDKRAMLFGVKGLYKHLEDVAADEGCLAVISFVKPNSSEERIMVKSGWATSTDAVPHALYSKPLKNQQNWNPPEDGVVQCQQHS